MATTAGLGVLNVPFVPNIQRAHQGTEHGLLRSNRPPAEAANPIIAFAHRRAEMGKLDSFVPSQIRARASMAAGRIRNAPAAKKRAPSDRAFHNFQH
jgi:hypothetical protein